MADGDRYHYDRRGRYIGKTSSKAPAGGGCAGLALLLVCGGIGWKECGDRSSSSDWSPPPVAPPSGVSPSFTTPETPVAPPAPTAPTAPSEPDVFEDNQACEWASLGGVEIQDSLWGEMMCFRDKDDAYEWRNACRPSLVNSPQKHRIDRRKHWCIPQ